MKMKEGIKIDEDNSEEQIKKRNEVEKRDRERMELLDRDTQSIVKGLEGFKQLEEMSKGVDMNISKDIKYVEREEDLELKEMYEEEQKKFNDLSKDLKDKLDGEIFMDMHGNVEIKEWKKEGEGL